MKISPSSRQLSPPNYASTQSGVRVKTFRKSALRLAGIRRRRLRQRACGSGREGARVCMGGREGRPVCVYGRMVSDLSAEKFFDAMTGSRIQRAWWDAGDYPCGRSRTRQPLRRSTRLQVRTLPRANRLHEAWQRYYLGGLVGLTIRVFYKCLRRPPAEWNVPGRAMSFSASACDGVQPGNIGGEHGRNYFG